MGSKRHMKVNAHVSRIYPKIFLGKYPKEATNTSPEDIFTVVLMAFQLFCHMFIIPGPLVWIFQGVNIATFLYLCACALKDLFFNIRKIRRFLDIFSFSNGLLIINFLFSLYCFWSINGWNTFKGIEITPGMCACIVSRAYFLFATKREIVTPGSYGIVVPILVTVATLGSIEIHKKYQTPDLTPAIYILSALIMAVRSSIDATKKKAKRNKKEKAVSFLIIACLMIVAGCGAGNSKFYELQHHGLFSRLVTALLNK